MPTEKDLETPDRRPGPYLELVLRPFPESVTKGLSRDVDGITIDLCEHALARFPHYLDALKALGEAYTNAKRYVEALRVDKRLAALLPDDATVHYNLACSYALLGLVDQAFEALERAIALGYDDFEHLVNDKDLANLRDDPRFEALLGG